ncbi:MAG: sugar transferase [Sedimentisphaerales bacterium]|nr:sugar transferase [Sedimentisphaerales bacterium]
MRTGQEGLLRFALTGDPVAGVVLNGMRRSLVHQSKRSTSPAPFQSLDIGKTVFAFPEDWKVDTQALQDPMDLRDRELLQARADIYYYQKNVVVPFEHENVSEQEGVTKPWLVLSNGRFATNVDMALLERVLSGVKADVVAVTADPKLLGEREEVRLTAGGKVAAFHRVYIDSAEFAFAATDWPHHLFIKTCVLERVLPDGVLPLSFSALTGKCRTEGLTLCAVNIGGAVLDLDSEEGLLSFCGMGLSKKHRFTLSSNGSKVTSERPRCVGKVLLGRDVSIAPDAVIVGPTILGDGACIEPGAIIYSSIVGPGVCVPKNELVQNCIIKGPRYERLFAIRNRENVSRRISKLSHVFEFSKDPCRSFRKWGPFSYARCLKRITDCLVAVVILLLFAPLFPFIALAIKLTSPGPVFYRDWRQGLHGKDFGCLKFRTMITGAHAIQEKLRIVSQVDGPQFKMEDDPRISTVGRFLRETYIDEIPQFFNVLAGQMSVVGPRPSPESENTLCPLWRDARLSVRPGITGLWQVHRTRQPMRDFQEWIHYDIEYVRNLSLKMDLSICWQTTRKLLDNFISQF